MSALDIAASGMHAADVRMGAAAGNIANVNTPGYQPQSATQSTAPGGGVQSKIANAAPGYKVDLGTEIMNFMSAANAYKANAMVVRVSSKMVESLYRAIDNDRDNR
ncbi:MAG: flagellar basal body rod protein [Proteobacteria bacterium]|nr:flagellar basal body rod protein [Pseudomonadota bacterium]